MKAIDTTPTTSTIESTSVDSTVDSASVENNVTAHINNNESIKLDATLSASITSMFSTEETLAVKREALRSLTNEEIKTLDETRKDNREQLANIFRTTLDVDSSVLVCNELLAPLNGGDDASRKRAQKRRDFCKKCLTLSYPSYDFNVTKGRNGGLIDPDFVGDESSRKAIKLMVMYHELATYISDLPALNTENVAILLRKGVPQQATILDTVPANLVVGEATGNTMSTLQEIADKISAQQQEADKVANA